MSGRIFAVVDVGSNSVRLLVARALSPTAIEVIDEERFVARLAQGQVDGVLTAAGFERGLRALRVVGQVARAHAPTQIIAVGTEALRRAPNAAEFVARARAEAGLDVRVLSAAEEAYAGFVGAINSTILRDGYLLDLGGGSLEIIRIEDRTSRDIQSIPFGAIYASERFFSSDPPSAREVRALRKAVRQALSVDRSPALIGTGGAVRNLARMIRTRRRYPLTRLHGLAIAPRELRRLARDLTTTGAADRRKLPAIGSDRIETLPAAAVVIDEVLALCGADHLTVAGQGLREGLVWQALRPSSPVISDVRGASIAGLALANGVSELATEPVVAAAATLFDATASLFGGSPADRDLLLAAARLAGIGLHVDYYNRDRHAEYLVHSGDLHGFSHREIVILAALVRWSAGGSPDLSPYRTIIEPGDERRSTILAALLGTARAVRRRPLSPVHGFSVTVAETAIELRLTGGGALDAELYEIERQQRRLESVLKLPVEIRLR